MFITFEGTEGSGKSTLLKNLGLLLEQAGYAVHITREPGGSLVAEKIRALILGEKMDPRTELFLYEAARAEHLAQTILPALHQKKTVLCDRFTASTLAYQAHARGLPWDEVKTLNRIAVAGLEPDLNFFLDIDPAVGLKRANDPNRFEAEGVEFQTRVREGFLKASAENPTRWITLDAGRLNPHELAQEAFNHLQARLAKASEKSPRG